MPNVSTACFDSGTASAINCVVSAPATDLTCLVEAPFYPTPGFLVEIFLEGVWTILPATIDFGSFFEGAGTENVPFRVTNTGNIDLEIAFSLETNSFFDYGAPVADGNIDVVAGDVYEGSINLLKDTVGADTSVISFSSDETEYSSVMSSAVAVNPYLGRFFLDFTGLAAALPDLVSVLVFPSVGTVSDFLTSFVEIPVAEFSAAYDLGAHFEELDGADFGGFVFGYKDVTDAILPLNKVEINTQVGTFFVDEYANKYGDATYLGVLNEGLALPGTVQSDDSTLYVIQDFIDNPTFAFNVRPFYTEVLAPDDVPNLQIWLKSDTLSLSDGQALSNGDWDSVGAVAVSMNVFGLSDPTFQTSELNGYPAVRCDVAQFQSLMGSTSYAATYHVFIIARMPAGNFPGNHSLYQNGSTNRTKLTGVSGTANWNTTAWDSDNIYRLDGVDTPGGNAGRGAAHIYEFQFNLGTGGISQLILGNDGPGISWIAADFFEVATFAQVLTLEQRNGVVEGFKQKYNLP